MAVKPKLQDSVKPLSVVIPHKEAIEFVKSEYDHVSKYTSVIYDTRDRFFANYMTVAIGLFGFLGFLLHQDSPLQPPAEYDLNLLRLAIFALIVLIVFGLGTLFLLSGNWLARDYYRQRRRRMQRLLLATSSEADLRNGIQEYLSFSRDKTKWRYRVTSIYAIYCSSISLANSLGVLMAMNIAGFTLRNRVSVLLLFATFFVQHLMCYAYMQLYTHREYPEG